MEGSPGLPLPMLLAGLGIAVLVVGYRLRTLHGMAAFMLVLLSARYMATFFHDYTTNSVFAGQSLNSFLTLGLTALAIFYCRRNLVRYRVFLPAYAFMGALLVSGLWNLEAVGTINAMVRQMLFLGVMLGVMTAIDAEPKDGSTSRGMLVAFVAPLFLQVVSIVFRLAKASESDGSISYIGGYVHESVFSILLLTAMVIVTLAVGMSVRRQTTLLAGIFVALLLANYRTAMLATLPILTVHMIFGSSAHVRSSMTLYVRTAAALLAVGLGVILVDLFSYRMADLGTVLNAGSSLIRSPTDFDAQDRSLLSGRILIWNDYLFTTLRSDISHLVFGFGPDSWIKSFSLYAHNVYISYVYELGFFGLIAYLYMTVHFFVMAMRTRADKRWQLMAAHAGYFLLCLGTMPTFSIEGVLLYGIICGYTAYYYLTIRLPTRFVIPSNYAPFRPAEHVRPALGRRAQYP